MFFIVSISSATWLGFRNWGPQSARKYSRFPVGDGFISSGNRSEIATRKAGLALTYRITDNQDVRVRHDIQENLETAVQQEAA